LRVIEEALPFLERTPLVALHVATLACARLDATSALLVELRKEAKGKEVPAGDAEPDLGVDHGGTRAKTNILIS